MARDVGTDDRRVRVRAGKGSRPRTKVRPDWSTKPLGRVVAIDRGRYGVVVDGAGTRVNAVRAKELGRGSVVMGDRVRLTGDLSGRVDTLARIVAVEERRSILRRSLEDAPDQKGEKVIVANADLLVVVTALADPPPRTGMINRCMVAAFEAGMDVVLCLTKSDLADPCELRRAYADFEVTVVATCARADGGVEGLEDLEDLLTGRFSVLVGHSGVGKSTLINALVPGAGRAVGHVNEVTGKGRHTSTSSESFELPGGGWIVDTPGVRSFGLGHVRVEDVLRVFPEVAEAAAWCLPMCTHLAGETSCALDEWRLGAGPFRVSTGGADEGGASDEEEVARRAALVESARRLLGAVATAEAASRAAR
ncbi:ribosome small subunit-dependent GTPase A [Schaalia sp. 19OD2882]|uniref:ribosome small subunit-dependent GTPase A n=1 Tax=Schaalia sp. 19OD2882 TaxID=2794089 RepID=UPI001C1EF49A|nr:ribosome small subunit-dependent GTPase A [Schaalia sp. 19OD2882]QWW20321.1 ribosome small subunit-dependent GTPase A [Schaalia sp. 19OD2882]